MTTPDLEVLQPRAGAAVVVLTGEHDLATKSSLSTLLGSLLDTHDLVVADLSQVLFIDSSTLGVLVSASRTAHDAGKDVPASARHGADRQADPRDQRAARPSRVRLDARTGAGIDGRRRSSAQTTLPVSSGDVPHSVAKAVTMLSPRPDGADLAASRGTGRAAPASRTEIRTDCEDPASETVKFDCAWVTALLASSATTSDASTTSSSHSWARSVSTTKRRASPGAVADRAKPRVASNSRRSPPSRPSRAR